jgi:hypothetical protein
LINALELINHRTNLVNKIRKASSPNMRAWEKAVKYRVWMKIDEEKLEYNICLKNIQKQTRRMPFFMS